MAIKIGGPHSNFEKDMKKSIAVLDAKLQIRSDKISAILIDAYSKPNFSAKYWRNVRKGINKQYNEMKVIYSKWAKKGIPAAYRSSMRFIFDNLNRNKEIARRAKRSYSDLVTSPRSNKIQSVLVKDAIQDWIEALTKGQSGINRLTRKTQQLILQESFIDASVVKAIESGNLMNNKFYKSLNLSNTLAGTLNELADIVDGQKYVVAGSRKYSPNYYAEMVTRVKFHEAQSFAAVATAGNYGTSLLKVSNHNTVSEICQKYEGKVYSVGGKDNRFPPLETMSPFHVNCLHLMFPVFVEGLEADGGLDKWEAFSKGKSKTPPGPKSFIPVDERE